MAEDRIADEGWSGRETGRSGRGRGGMAEEEEEEEESETVGLGVTA